MHFFCHNSAMRKTKLTIWCIYILIYILFVTKRCYNLFTPGEIGYNYFNYLIHFDVYFIFIYFFNMMQVLFTTLHLMPVLLYVFKIDLFNKRVWKFLLSLRIIFDILGNNYEWHFLNSIKQVSLPSFYILLTLSIAVYIPSYYASYRYAFKNLYK